MFAGIIFFGYVVFAIIRLRSIEEKTLKEQIKQILKKGSILRKRTTLTTTTYNTEPISPKTPKSSKKLRRKKKLSMKNQVKQIDININTKNTESPLRSESNHSPNKLCSSPNNLVKSLSHTEGNNDSPLSQDEHFFDDSPRITSRSDEIKITLDSPKRKRSSASKFSIKLYSIPMTSSLELTSPKSEPESSRPLFSINSPTILSKRDSNSTQTQNKIKSLRSEKEEIGNESCEISVYLKESVANVPNFSSIKNASPKSKKKDNTR